MSDYELPTGLTLGSVRFSRNCSYSCSCELSSRIAAFGAIRRAAEVMRWHEANAKRLERLRPDGLNEYEAQAIRRAIRAAIRSPKA